MGKNLHRTIIPFIEKVLYNNYAVRSVNPIELEDFYAYKISRRHGMSDVIVVLSDDYYFSEMSILNKPSILKNGGFFLIARPEANNFEQNYPSQKLSVGKIGTLLRVLNREDFWNY